MWNRDEWRTRQSTRMRVALPHNGFRLDARDGFTADAIVVLDRAPWRVLEIREKPADLWPADYEEAWQRVITGWIEHEAARAASEAGPVFGTSPKARPEPIRAEWQHRPINLALQHVDRPKSKHRHLVAPVSYDWQVLPEHFSVCRLCNELPPCRHVEMEQTITTEVDKAERLMSIPRGACLGCGETITSRMKATRFPGPNLWRPDWGTDSAVFHARQQEECSNGVWKYEQQWKEQGLHVLNPTLSDAAEGDR